jgi:Holliday junction resolvasome RuvABC endonuclease subunit
MYIGIDPGLATTCIVVMDNEGNVVTKDSWGYDAKRNWKETQREPIAKRYLSYYNALNRFITRNKITTATIIMEESIASLMGNGRKLVELKGVYLIALARKTDTKKIFLISPTTIKKHFTGYGVASKEEMIERCNQLGYQVATEHEADATAMAYCGLHFPKMLLPKNHQNQ